MERIISYDELPKSKGQSIYFRMETDPRLYVNLLAKGYKIVRSIIDADESTIYVTGRRQDYDCQDGYEYRQMVISKIDTSLKEKGIEKPQSIGFNYFDLVNYKYELPFVFKNENQNGGKEKFLIATEEDYDNLISACDFLLSKKWLLFNFLGTNDIRYHIDYQEYLSKFVIQEYIQTPSEYNTTVRLLTTPSNDLLYASLKYNKPEEYQDETTLLGLLLHEIYPLSTKSIVSNTLSGGENILIGEELYLPKERKLLASHNVGTDQFESLVSISEQVHQEFQSELGIICGFDYIYDREQNKWFLLEYHSRPMVGDYSKRQGIPYETSDDRLSAEGRVRATSLALTLKRN